ncbi:MAG: ATP-binding protein, partial [Ruminococcus flavefaciens]|nr:ATP-binding protein [Ruminococcus flavefaciens]
VNLKGKSSMYELVTSIPSANILLSSLRSVGYTPETAIADIIDNSISVKASTVSIEFDWINQRIVIIDDGEGMSNQDLLNSMSIGSTDPLMERNIHDLGRFGMGMKTASFSLGKKLTVLTKKDGWINNASWDLDYVQANDKWEVLIYEPTCDFINDLSNRIIDYNHGTVICISAVDKLISSVSAAEKKKFFKMIENVKNHLSLVFHRYIESGKISIFVNHNDMPLVPWNPFIPQNNARQELEPEEVVENGHKVIIRPYVLPHKTKFANDDEVIAAGGYKGWLHHQGFYVYRNERLIIYGTWFGLFKKEMSFNLARIQLDIYSDSDFDWQIDIKKSKAVPPAYTDDIIRLAAEKATQQSVKVYNSRGAYSDRKGSANAPQLSYVWEQRKDLRGSYSFVLNKKHTLLNKLKTSLTFEQKEMLNAYLNLVEKCSPMELSGFNDMSVSKGILPENEYNELAYQAKRLISTLIINGSSKEEIRSLLQQLPDYTVLMDDFDNIYTEACNGTK